MARRSDNSLAALLLVSRVVPSALTPLSARDFWKLADRVPDPGVLLGRDRPTLTCEFGEALGERIATLLDRATALAFAIEELEHQGIKTITVFDDDYPERWRTLLGNLAPVALHAAGPPALLGGRGVAIVGSRDVAPPAADAAEHAAIRAARAGRTVISGGPRGTGKLAMSAALGAGGVVVGVLADALVRSSNDVGVRRAITEQRLCLVTPYAPTAPFSAANAVARNKLIYALGDLAFVVTSDLERGATWAGATEALKNRGERVLVWTGAGAGAGNQPLVDLGAVAVPDLNEVDRALDAGVSDTRAACRQGAP